MFKTVEMTDDGLVRLIDQRLLPTEEVFVDCKTYKEVCVGIKDMVVRGAPAIGVTAALGIALGSTEVDTEDCGKFRSEMLKICEAFAATRPTAVNLFWAIEKMKSVIEDSSYSNVNDLKSAIKKKAMVVWEEDRSTNYAMAQNGESLIDDKDTILTHCNAGALATSGGYGTALGVIKGAHEKGKDIKVYADETRPFLQGARLTAWELLKENIRVCLITDNMAGHFMKKGKINKIIVGADRIAANGDAANKIGTYSLSILAKEHGIPFYVAAPLSTIDRKLENGDCIPIEERTPDEVTHIRGVRIAPEGVEVENPAFDVTPHKNITAIITEKGIIRAPFDKGIEEQFG